MTYLTAKSNCVFITTWSKQWLISLSKINISSRSWFLLYCYWPLNIGTVWAAIQMAFVLSACVYENCHCPLVYEAVWASLQLPPPRILTLLHTLCMSCGLCFFLVSHNSYHLSCKQHSERWPSNNYIKDGAPCWRRLCLRSTYHLKFGIFVKLRVSAFGFFYSPQWLGNREH